MRRTKMQTPQNTYVRALGGGAHGPVRDAVELETHGAVVLPLARDLDVAARREPDVVAGRQAVRCP